ncbi:MAG: DUF1828 domain-containing protein [Gaiellales bacterium]|nr:DUF1828 domain-containing protein [Gaiellales bacterium]
MERDAEGTEGYRRLTEAGWCALQTGQSEALNWLRRPERLAADTGFVYPSKGPVILFMDSDGGLVRLSEGGRLLKYLETQGLDLSLDQILSRTVFHAVREVEGMAMGNGMLYLDGSVDELPANARRFVQLVLEIVGLRHAKYKDALVHLSRGQDALTSHLTP